MESYHKVTKNGITVPLKGFEFPPWIAPNAEAQISKIHESMVRE